MNPMKNRILWPFFQVSTPAETKQMNQRSPSSPPHKYHWLTRNQKVIVPGAVNHSDDQLAFLSYGLNTLWKSRPLFLVGSQQAFALLFANEVGD